MIPFPKQVNRGVLELRGLSSIQANLLLSYLQLYHSSSKGECWLHFLWQNRTVKICPLAETQVNGIIVIQHYTSSKEVLVT